MAHKFWNFPAGGLPNVPQTQPTNWSGGQAGVGWYLPDIQKYAPAPAPAPAAPKFDPYLDPSYAATSSAGENAYQHATAERDYQYHRGAQSYGYDKSGGLVTGGPDLNPYAQAAILKKHYLDSQRGINNSYAAQGQLYAGSRQNAQNENDYSYGLSSDQLQRGAQDFYHSATLGPQNVSDQNLFQLAALLGPAFANWLSGQRGT